MLKPPEILVSLYIGCYEHAVAVGLSNGELLEEFSISHDKAGFNKFFTHIEKHEKKYSYPVSVAMEGYNGYARPLDSLIKKSDYRLFNINNLKLNRFKEIFPSPCKTDPIDSRKGLELFQLKDHLPMAADVLQEVAAVPQVNQILKRLTRRRVQLVNERVRYVNMLQSNLQAVSPGLLGITNNAANVWFLRLLGSVDNLEKLSRLRESSLMKINGIGSIYAEKVKQWQHRSHFSDETPWVSDMIIDDTKHILALRDKINHLESQIEGYNSRSEIAQGIISIPGYGLICAGTLAGEIGTLERFGNESSLAMYLGMSPLVISSGSSKGSKAPRQVNKRAKAVMMTGIDRHRKQVEESGRYYAKKRLQGKSHNQAIRALGRHLVRVLFKMLKEGRPYVVKVDAAARQYEIKKRA